MKSIFTLLAILSFSASAEIVLVGKPSTDYSFQKDRIGSLAAFESKGESPWRYRGATTHLHLAELGVSENGMLVLKRLILHSHFDGLERGNNDRVKNNAIKIGPLKTDALDTTISWGTSKFDKAMIYVNLMKPLEILSVKDLSADPKAVEEKVTAGLKAALEDKLDVAKVDALYEYRIDNKSNDDVRQALIASRVTDVQKLLDMAIPMMAKHVASQSVYATLPEFIKDGYEVRTTRLEGEIYHELSEKGSEASDLDPALRGLKFEKGAVALKEKDASKWLQAYLTSQLSQFPKGGYSKGADGEIVYTASANELAALGKILGQEDPMGSVSYKIADLQISFFAQVVGDSTNQYVRVKLPIKIGEESKDMAIDYRISSNSLMLAAISVDGKASVAADEKAPKFLARDMKNMLLQSLVPRSMTADIGKTEGGFSIGLSAAQDDSNPFGDESTSGGYLIIKK